jgi:hypothetical protein
MKKTLLIIVKIVKFLKLKLKFQKTINNKKYFNKGLRVKIKN